MEEGKGKLPEGLSLMRTQAEPGFCPQASLGALATAAMERGSGITRIDAVVGSLCSGQV